MASALLIKSGRNLLTPKILTTTNSSRQDLLVKSTEGYTQKNWTTLSSIFTTNQSFFVSYPMKITVSPSKNHQVFINFRGNQLRHNFVSHLINAFKNEEIQFFVDNDEQRGKDLKNLFVRIEESKIALAIFSTRLRLLVTQVIHESFNKKELKFKNLDHYCLEFRYPESKWCMNELVKMKKRADEGKLQIIPIFYKVEPRDVRKPRRESEFGKNFWKLMEASDRRDPIQKWREALECISNKMGLSLGDNSSESDFVKVIVKAVKRVNEDIGVEEEDNHGGKSKGEFSRIAIAQMKKTSISKSTFR